MGSTVRGRDSVTVTFSTCTDTFLAVWFGLVTFDTSDPAIALVYVSPLLSGAGLSNELACKAPVL